MVYSMNQAAARRYPRFSFRLPVRCESSTVHGYRAIGVTRNVSRGGLLLETSHPLPPGSPVSLMLCTGAKNARAEATVVWAASGPPCRMGLRFTMLTEADRKLWEQLLHFQAGPTPRASIRIPIALEVTCLLEPDTRLNGRAALLSEGGLMVSLPRNLPPRTRLTVAILQWPTLPPVAVEVKWSRAHPRGKGATHGLQFLSGTVGTELFSIGALLGQLAGRPGSAPSPQPRQ
ncbi:MAG: PilZ domain-containing protein [Candidatus Methylomirabilales bacterium]